MEGLRSYGKYYELMLDNVFKIKIDLNKNNRNEYILMNLLNTGGSINPFKINLIYSNRSNQANCDFGNKIKLQDYKKVEVQSVNQFKVTNADDSIDIFHYDESRKVFRNEEKNIICKMDNDSYVNTNAFALVNKDNVEMDLEVGRNYPTLIKDRNRIIAYNASSTGLSKITNTILDEVIFTKDLTNINIDHKKDNQVIKKVICQYDTNENLERIIIKNVNNQEEIIVHDYSLTLTVGLMIILNNITKERVSISLLDNQTTITRDYDLEENKSKSFLITYLDEHTIIENLQTNRKTYFIYDKDDKIHSVLTRDNYLEYYRYDSFKLLEKSRSLALKKTDNHNLIQNHDFSNGLQSWTALKATPSVLDNTTASNYIYNKMARLSYNGELYQDINVKGTSLDSLTLAFLYSNCDSGDFSIKASIILTPTKDGEEMIEENVIINDIDNSNSKYFFHVMDLHAAKSFKKIRVKFTCLGRSCFISGVYLLKRSSITKMEYDDDGVLFSISHDGRIIKTNKDEDGKILGEQINDRYFNLSYLDNEETLFEEYGVKVITTKDEYDRVIKQQITSGNNKSVQEIFYNGDELTKITDHIFEESYTYTEDKLPLSFVDKEGNTTSYQYNEKSFLSKLTQGNKSIDYTYTNKDQLETFDDYQNEYDDYGRLVSVNLINPLIQYEYNEDDTLKSETILGETTTYTYENDNITKIQNGERIFNITYDTSDNIEKIVDNYDEEIRFEYDENSNLAKEIKGSNFVYNQINKDGLLNSSVTKIDKDYFVENFDDLNKKESKTFSQYINMMYRYPTLIRSGSTYLTTYNTFCCFFDDESLALRNIKVKSNNEEVVRFIHPDSKLAINTSGQNQNTVSVSKINPLIYQTPKIDQTQGASFSLKFRFKKYSGNNNGDLMYFGQKTTERGSLKLKVCQKTDGFYLGLYGNAVGEHLLWNKFEVKIPESGWNDVGICLQQRARNDGDYDVSIIFMVNDNVLLEDGIFSKSFDMFNDGAHLCFGGTKINQLVTNGIYVTLGYIILTLDQGEKVDFSSNDYFINKELYSEYHQYVELISDGGYYLTGKEEFKLTSTEYEKYDIFPLNGSFNSLKGTKPYIFNKSKNTNNERNFFFFNKLIKEYVYEGGNYLEYEFPYSTSGTISIGAILSIKDFSQTLLSLKFGKIYLELSTLNSTILLKKITINSNGSCAYSTLFSSSFNSGKTRLTLSWTYTGGDKFSFKLYQDSTVLNSFTLISSIYPNVYLLLGRDYEGVSSYFDGLFNLITASSYVGSNINALLKVTKKIRVNHLFDQYKRPVTDMIKNTDDQIIVKNRRYYASFNSYNSNMISREIISYNNNQDKFYYNYLIDSLDGNTKVSSLLRKITYNDVETSYTYDEYNRLTSETTNGVTSFYNYDEHNNLIVQSDKVLVYDETCPFKLIKYGEFDQDNVQVSGHEYSYSSNNISSIKMVENNEIITFTYDYLGRRTSKNDISYLYLNNLLVKEEHSSYTLKFIYDENNLLVGLYYNDIPYFYLRNSFGNIYGIVDQDGNKVVEYTYNAWGKHKVLNPDGSENTSSLFIGNINPIRYKGYYYDVETGLFWLSSRYYSPELGRFISPADISTLNPSSINGLNLYSYANNNPINIYYNTTLASAGIVGGGESSSPSRNLPSVPWWLGTLSTGLDHGFTMINPIRSAIACLQFTDLWDLMRLDGVTELPGALSKVATGIGWGLSIAGGVIAGYEKYASGASLSSSIAGGLINAGISIGGMYASTAIATAAMGALAASSLAIPGGVIIVGGAVIAVVAGITINHLFTKLEIGGNTIEGHLNDFVDWLIFWD